MILALIPARGGSKGLPRKNLAILRGKPLIAYSIRTALECKSIDRVIVSTDDAEIARISERCGAGVPFLRPHELAQDETPMIPVMRHAVDCLEKEDSGKVDIIILLQPTSPLRETSDIELCIEKIVKEGADSAITICETEHNPYAVMVKLRDDKISPLIEQGRTLMGNSRRQDLPVAYRINGSVFAVKRDVLMEKNAILTDNTAGVIIPQWRSVDVDSELDLKIVATLMKQMKSGSR